MLDFDDWLMAELRRVEAMIDDDRLALNEGAFFDRKGRRMRIDEDEAAG